MLGYAQQNEKPKANYARSLMQGAFKTSSALIY